MRQRMKAISAVTVRGLVMIVLLGIGAWRAAADDAPTTSATGFTNSAAPEQTAVSLSWANGDGDGRIVVGKRWGSPTDPVDATDYTSCAGDFSSESGDYTEVGGWTTNSSMVLYKGNRSAALNVTGLSRDEVYYFKIYEYSNSTPPIAYRTVDAPEVMIRTLASEPSSYAQTILFSDVTASTLNLSWTSGSGTKRLVIAREGSPVSWTPADGRYYTANANFSAAANQLNGNKVVYNGTGTNAAITGLTSGSNYYFAVVEYNGVSVTDGGQNYKVDQYPMESQQTVGSAAIAVKGNGVAIANGDDTPQEGDNTDFGNVIVDGATKVNSFTIFNIGTADLTLTNTPKVLIAGHAGDFTVTAVPGSPVEHGGSTAFSITFDPTVMGVRTALVVIANTDNDDNPFVFSLKGTGTSADMVVLGTNLAAIANGAATPDADKGTYFGAVLVAGGVQANVFTVTNSGLASLTLNGSPKVAVSGANASDFTVTVNPLGTVAAGGTTTFTVQFDPSASGTRSAILSIANSDTADDPYVFSISGTGASAEIVVRGNSVRITDGATSPNSSDHSDFGSTLVDGGHVDRVFVISNEGLAPLTVSSIALDGTHAADFSLTFTGPAVLATGESTNLTVRFNPSESGLRTAELLITNSDATESPFNFVIQGTGSTAPSMAISGNGVTVTNGSVTPITGNGTDFGNRVIYGSYQQIFVITNSGNAELSLNGDPKVAIAGDSDFAVTTQPSTPIPTNGSVTFVVTFTPSSAGEKTAAISLANTDTNKNPFAFAIKGTGTTAAQPTTPASSIAFSSITNNRMTISWTSGSGVRRIVVARATADVTWVPDDGNDYAANNDFQAAADQGAGNKVVYNGTGASFSLTNLTALTDYYIKIFEYNGTNLSANYLLTSANGHTNTTLVVLSDFSVYKDGAEVKASWETLSEYETVGFFLYREENGGWTKINGSLIPAQGEGGMGAIYTCVDAGAVLGGTYTYRLEEILTSGGSEFYGPFVRTVQSAQQPEPPVSPTPVPTPIPEEDQITARNDFDGDGISDIGYYRAENGSWSIARSRDGLMTTSFGYAGTVPVTGDFDGDSLCDYGCYFAPSGAWYLFKSAEGFWENSFGFEGTVPVVGDFDGDGRDDFGCYYPPEGAWTLFNSTAGFFSTHFGYAETLPITGDFDGDGRCDFGCYYPPSGSWYIYKSSVGFWTTGFGFADTKPIVGDFDADGICDFGCYHPVSGSWYIYKSKDGFWTTRFGYEGTEPVTGDYDGDGYGDFGCYDASSRTWYLFTSTRGFEIRTFGEAGAAPIGR